MEEPEEEPSEIPREELDVERDGARAPDGDELENKIGLSGIILTPNKVAKVVDIEDPDRFEEGGITYGVTDPLLSEDYRAILIYNKNDPEPRHHIHDGEDGDYTSELMDETYLENKMEQLSGVKPGEGSVDFMNSIYKVFGFLRNNLENILILILVIFLILKVPWMNIINSLLG